VRVAWGPRRRGGPDSDEEEQGKQSW
jgi:hypothetical protein